jgi:hypothetical protein
LWAVMAAEQKANNSRKETHESSNTGCRSSQT